MFGEAPQPFDTRTAGPFEPDDDNIALVSPPLAVSFFDGLPLQVRLYPPFDRGTLTGEEIRAVERALTALLAKDSEARHAVSPEVLAYCHTFLEKVGAADDGEPLDLAMLAITDPKDIWRFVRPRYILLALENTPTTASFECDCDWEQEHGLSIEYRNGDELIRVGAQG